MREDRSLLQSALSSKESAESIRSTLENTQRRLEESERRNRELEEEHYRIQVSFQTANKKVDVLQTRLASSQERLDEALQKNDVQNRELLYAVSQSSRKTGDLEREISSLSSQLSSANTEARRLKSRVVELVEVSLSLIQCFCNSVSTCPLLTCFHFTFWICSYLSSLSSWSYRC